MSDKTETPAPTKKGKMGKIIIGGVALLVLVGGGVGAGVYASSAGLIGGGHGAAADDNKPKLVPKSEQKPADAEGEGGGHGGGGEGEAPENHGMATPAGEGGDRYASTYFAMEKEFTANLKDSAHFIQVGVAISTPYDNTVIEHLKTNEIAVRSAILMSLGEATEEQVFAAEGKRKLQAGLAKAINDTLKQKEGFGGVSNVYFTSFVVQ